MKHIEIVKTNLGGRKKRKFYVTHDILKAIDAIDQWCLGQSNVDVRISWDDLIAEEVEKEIRNFERLADRQIEILSLRFPVELIERMKTCEKQSAQKGQLLDWNRILEKIFLKVLKRTVSSLEATLGIEVPGDLENFKTKRKTNGRTKNEVDYYPELNNSVEMSHGDDD